MICVCIADIDFEQCRLVLNDIEMAEIRLDLLNFSPAQVKEIFSKHPQLIATYRPGRINMSEEERKELLISAVNAGAAYVDVEIETETAFKEAVKQACWKKGCKLIISYHNFEKTPSKDELETIIEQCFKDDADIAKVACQVNGEADAARILSLYDYDRESCSEKKIVVLGMGEKGKIIRLVAPLLGAPFTFAALSAGKETAPGQLDRQTLQDILDRIKG
jgi:3-dehydroquinate dehydratase type I